MHRTLLLVVFCTGAAVGLHAAGRPDLMQEVISPEMISARADLLHLTVGQRADLATLQAEHRTALLSNAEVLRQANNQLVTALALSKPDEQEVLAKYRELARAEMEQKLQRLRATVRLKNLLTDEQLALFAHLPETTTTPSVGSSVAGDNATIPEMLQRVRSGIEQWRREGRDLTRVNALWDEFRRHAEAREHAAARQKLQELIAVLSAPAAEPPR